MICICKKETGSVKTTLYKDTVYSYEYVGGLYTIKVYDKLGRYVYFFEDDFEKSFYSTDQEIHKFKLEKIKNNERTLEITRTY